MRELMLIEIKKLKSEQNGFKRKLWDGFNIGTYHISEFSFEGIPTDEMFLDVYNEVMRWYFSNNKIK